MPGDVTVQPELPDPLPTVTEVPVLPGEVVVLAAPPPFPVVTVVEPLRPPSTRQGYFDFGPTITITHSPDLAWLVT